MNNEKLKIDLCGRLPYNPKVEIYEEVTYTTTVSEINLINVLSRKFKPLLFPISSLTKKIQLADYNNGEPFLPIVELAKISFGKSQEWITIKSNEKGFYCQNESYRFHFNHLTKSFYIVNYMEVSPDFVANQADLFDLLNRWKIDYRGLIAEGLAIEVNESNNPYL